MTSASTNHAQRVMLAAAAAGATLFRNNSGQAYYSAQGSRGGIRVSKPCTVQLHPGDMVIRAAVPVRYGVGDGGSDYMGAVPVPVLARVFPVLLAIEAKLGTGRLQANQDRFMQGVARLGGLAIVARTPDGPAGLVRRVTGGDIDLLGEVHEA